MSKKLPVNGFNWIKKISKIDEGFIKNYDEDGDVGYFLMQILSILENYMIYILVYRFY